MKDSPRSGRTLSSESDCPFCLEKETTGHVIIYQLTGCDQWFEGMFGIKTFLVDIYVKGRIIQRNKERQRDLISAGPPPLLPPQMITIAAVRQIKAGARYSSQFSVFSQACWK